MNEFRGCVGFVRANAMISKAILLQAALTGIPERYRASHMFHILDDDKIHESNLEGNQERELSKYWKPEYKVWLFEYFCQNEQFYQNGKAWSEGRLGLPYDYPGLLSFVIKWIPQIKWANFCSEYSSTVVRRYWMQKLCSDILLESKISPSMALKYVSENPLWKLKGYWDGKELTIYA